MHEIMMGFPYRSPHKAPRRSYGMLAPYEYSPFGMQPPYTAMFDMPHTHYAGFPTDAPMRNGIEEATRAQVEAKTELEKVREKYEEIKKKFEDCEKKFKDADERLQMEKRGYGVGW
ncbi:hypothetical protein ACN47E_008413 [Coniothyrium glycines]